MPPMNRRDALKATTALLGGVLVTSAGALAACAPERRAAAARVLSDGDQALIEEIADTLLPTTAASPGAKAAGAGAAINLLLTDCYEPEAQRRLVRGLREFRGSGFMALARPEREALLRRVDAEAQEDPEKHWFTLARELSLRAYFSSETGMTKALRYVRDPGRWEGCVKLRPGQPAWA